MAMTIGRLDDRAARSASEDMRWRSSQPPGFVAFQEVRVGDVEGAVRGTTVVRGLEVQRVRLLPVRRENDARRVKTSAALDVSQVVSTLEAKPGTMTRS